MDEFSDGSSNVTRVDATGRGNDLTSNNTVASGSGLLGNAADFEFNNAEFLALNDNADVSLGNFDFWIQLWFWRESAIPDFPMFYGKGGFATAAQTEIHIGLDIATVVRLRVRISNGTTLTTFTGTTAINLATWYRVLVIHDATNDRLKVWLNNVLEIDAPYSNGCWDSTRSLQIGCLNSSGSVCFDGLIDEVTLGKFGVPTDAEAGILYNGGTPLPYPFKMLRHPGMAGRTEQLVGGLAA
jgi:hypothetical protein